MGVRLAALCWDADDSDLLAGFWAALLERHRDGPLVQPPDDSGFEILFVASAPGVDRAVGRTRNWTHPDLTSDSPEQQRALVERALALGASHLDVGQRPDEPHVVLADPEGNEFCLVEPENRFLAGCGRFGALAGSGTRAAGLFWSAALDWPLVWDQGEQTAIQSPAGGTKITWDGEGFDPVDHTGHPPNRLHFELTTTEFDVQVPRLIGLGATRAEGSVERAGPAVLLDPDGKPFTVRAS